MEGRQFPSTDEPPSRARLLVWLFVPGTVYFDRARDGCGTVCGMFLLLLWLGGMMACFACVGLPSAWLAVITMAAAQSISAAAALQLTLAQWDRKRRLLVSGFGATVLTVLFSTVFQKQILQRFVVPLEVPGSTVLMNPSVPKAGPQPGDWIALTQYGMMSFGQVAGRAGDRVEIHRDAIVINGLPYQRPNPWMKSVAEVVVPEDSYLVVPKDVDFKWAIAFPRDHVAYYAIVPKANIVSTAYHHWFGRQQVLPPLLPLKGWTPTVRHP